MKRKVSRLSSFWLLLIITALNLHGCSLSRFETGETTAEQDLWIKEEIIFGSDIPDGGAVSDDEWQQFLGEIVTPRFPDGFTVLNAHGQYLMQNGTIVREKSRILIMYLPGLSIESNRAITEIIEIYKRRFKQESVLRSTSPVRIRF